MKKIVYYVNQFYGQIGGEEAADQTPIVKESWNPNGTYLFDCSNFGSSRCKQNYSGYRNSVSDWKSRIAGRRRIYSKKENGSESA